MSWAGIKGFQIVFGMPSNNFKSSNVRKPFFSLGSKIIEVLFCPIFLIFSSISRDVLKL
jgi:hypothetical protein